MQNIGYSATMYSDHEGLVASWGTDWPVGDTIKYKKETVGLATYIPKKYIRKEAKDKEKLPVHRQRPPRKEFPVLHHVYFT